MQRDEFLPLRGDPTGDRAGRLGSGAAAGRGSWSADDRLTLDQLLPRPTPSQQFVRELEEFQLLEPPAATAASRTPAPTSRS